MIEQEKAMGEDNIILRTYFGDTKWREREIRRAPNQISGGSEKNRIFTYEEDDTFKYAVKSDFCDDDKEPECDILMESFQFVTLGE